MPSFSNFKIFVNFFVQPNFRKSSHRTYLRTMSKTFFCEENENSIQVSVLFSALLLQLPSGEDHIVSSTIRPESALCLWYDIVRDSF